ncbi:GntR family transcriptional regulator [Phenylobacterium sp.]|uniref:GntR family transcriptional regulator n=1 Tax=Phenylobacterium sp. TaxID=1871053 RepID=UPI003BAABA45
MSLKPDPIGLALRHLREGLIQGAYAPGQALPIGAVAQALGLSPTPVREALARLAGEGLVAPRDGGGYRVWPPDAVELADLYEAHLSAILASLRIQLKAPGRVRAWRGGEGSLPLGDGVADQVEAVFRRMVAACGNRHIVAWQQNLADRLAPARRVEPMVFPDVDDEASLLLEGLLHAPSLMVCGELVSAFHGRRRAAAEALARAQRDQHSLAI